MFLCFLLFWGSYVAHAEPDTAVSPWAPLAGLGADPSEEALASMENVLLERSPLGPLRPLLLPGSRENPVDAEALFDTAISAAEEAQAILSELNRSPRSLSDLYKTFLTTIGTQDEDRLWPRLLSAEMLADRPLPEVWALGCLISHRLEAPSHFGPDPVRVDPLLLQAFRLLHLLRHRPEEKLKCIDQLLQVDRKAPFDADILLVIARGLSLAGRFDAALDILARVFILAPQLRETVTTNPDFSPLKETREEQFKELLSGKISARPPASASSAAPESPSPSRPGLSASSGSNEASLKPGFPTRLEVFWRWRGLGEPIDQKRVLIFRKDPDVAPQNDASEKPVPSLALSPTTGDFRWYTPHPGDTFVEEKPVDREKGRLSVPFFLVKGLLAGLDAAPEAKRMTSLLTHTDDQPELLIRIERQNASPTLLYTTSNATDLLPFNVFSAGRFRLVESPICGRAITFLRRTCDLTDGVPNAYYLSGGLEAVEEDNPEESALEIRFRDGAGLPAASATHSAEIIPAEIPPAGHFTSVIRETSSLVGTPGEIDRLTLSGPADIGSGPRRIIFHRYRLPGGPPETMPSPALISVVASASNLPLPQTASMASMPSLAPIASLPSLSPLHGNPGQTDWFLHSPSAFLTVATQAEHELFRLLGTPPVELDIQPACSRYDAIRQPVLGDLLQSLRTMALAERPFSDLSGELVPLSIRALLDQSGRSFEAQVLPKSGMFVVNAWGGFFMAGGSPYLNSASDLFFFWTGLGTPPAKLLRIDMGFGEATLEFDRAVEDGVLTELSKTIERRVPDLEVGIDPDRLVPRLVLRPQHGQLVLLSAPGEGPRFAVRQLSESGNTHQESDSSEKEPSE
ncbi:MAG: hypothetical protein WA705_18065 [Candidatus Ozemobacteraceae bacterium]